MRVLVPTDAIEPSFADERRVDHDVRLLRVVPRLRVLIAIALDAESFVDDH